MSFALNPSSSPRAAIVIQRLKAIAHLGEDAEALFASLSDVQSLPAGAELVTERDTMERPRYLLSGWAAKVRWLASALASAALALACAACSVAESI